MQTRWGPRCFIPKRFLPAKYDYHRRAPARPPQAPDEVRQNWSKSPWIAPLFQGSPHSTLISLPQGPIRTLVILAAACEGVWLQFVF